MRLFTLLLWACTASDNPKPEENQTPQPSDESTSHQTVTDDPTTDDETTTDETTSDETGEPEDTELPPRRLESGEVLVRSSPHPFSQSRGLAWRQARRPRALGASSLRSKATGPWSLSRPPASRPTSLVIATAAVPSGPSVWR